MYDLSKTIQKVLIDLPTDCTKWGLHNLMPAIKDKTDLQFGNHVKKFPIYRCIHCAFTAETPNKRG